MSRRILGIDPGSRKTGWGVITSVGNSLYHEDSGVINLGNGSLPCRLDKLYSELNKIVKIYKPSEVAIEEVFLAHNAQSALKLGHARGVAILVVAQRALVIYEFSARRIKLAVVGNGSAEKKQVQEMVRRLLALQTKLPEDAADACAAAICLAHSFSPMPISNASKDTLEYSDKALIFQKRRRNKRFIL